MIEFGAFVDELVKIAGAVSDKDLGPDYPGVRVEARLPILTRLSKNPERARARIQKTLESDSVPSILGYKNVIVPEGVMPDLKGMGFRPTRVATPLPGERPLSISYRSGAMHAHKIGPAYFVHIDRGAPQGKRGGYVSLSGLKHGFTEGLPATIKRVRERDPLITGVNP